MKPEQIQALLAELEIVEGCVHWWALHYPNPARRRPAEISLLALRKGLQDALDSEKRPRKAHKEGLDPYGEESVGGDGELSPI
jgi:hypothetical protein